MLGVPNSLNVLLFDVLMIKLRWQGVLLAIIDGGCFISQCEGCRTA